MIKANNWLCRCVVFTASSGRVQSGLTSDAERSGSLRASGRAATQFDYPETLSGESSVETTTDTRFKVCFITFATDWQR